MTAEPDTPLEQAHRHVREAGQRVADQLALVNDLYAAGRHDEHRKAREMLFRLADLLMGALQELKEIEGSAPEDAAD